MAGAGRPSLEIKELPQLKFNQRRDRLSWDSVPSIQSILKLKKKILTNDFVEFHTQLSESNEKLHNLLKINNPKEIVGVNKTNLPPTALFNEIPWDWVAPDSQIRSKGVGLSEEGKTWLRKKKQQANERVIDMIKSLSNELEKTVSDFEQKHAIDLAIYETSTLYICPSCKKILGRSKFKNWKCNCGEDIKQPSDVEKMPIALLTKYVTDFLENNCWFEYGTAIFLNRNGYNTFIGLEVMGGSGVWHEIDVIAQNPKAKVRIFIECKTKQVAIQDVFVLAGKMRDIGISIGMICSTKSEQNSEIRLVARANGIIMAYDVVDRMADFWDSLLSKVVYDT